MGVMSIINEFGYIKGSTITTAEASKITARAEALYDLFNKYGRGRVSEEHWIGMYFNGELPQFIKEVLEGTFKITPLEKKLRKTKKRRNNA